MKHALVSIVLVAVSTGATQADQAPLDPRQASRWEHLTTWLDAVETHAGGTLDSATIAMASWPELRLRAVVADIGELARFLERAHARFERTGQLSTHTYARRSLSMAEVQRLLRLTDEEARRGDVSRLVVRATLLHTDIAAGLDPALQSGRSADPPGALTVLDGRQQGIVDRGPHWDLARALLDLIPAVAPGSELKRQWYVSTAAFMQSRFNMADLSPHIRRATKLFPDDADILFHGGWMHETLAGPLAQHAVRGMALPAGLTLDVANARTHLREARTFFRRALASRQDHVEARVRLGRVLGLLEQHGDAADQLRRVADKQAPSPIGYYALLFLGREEAILGRHDEARASFERAAALYPRAQSPRLGLSSLARSAGDRASAMAALAPLATPEAAESVDPWWTYFAWNRDAADRRLTEWRRSAALASGASGQ